MFCAAKPKSIELIDRVREIVDLPSASIAANKSDDASPLVQMADDLSFSSQPGKKRGTEDQYHEKNPSCRNWMVYEYHEASLRKNKGLAETDLHDGSKNKSQNHRCYLKAESAQKIAKQTKKDHDEYVQHIIVKTISPDHAEKENKRKEDRIWNLKDLNPNSNQRQVQDEEQNVSNIHARNQPPKNVRMLHN